MNKFQLRLTPKRQKLKSANSLVLIVMLMMALVSSGNAVSITHAHERGHSMSDMAFGIASASSSYAVHRTDSMGGSTHANDSAFERKSDAVAEIASTSESVGSHCQHQGMSSRSVQTPQNTAHVEVEDVALEDDMDCCEEECSCPADLCFNFSSTALLQPSIETEILVARTAAASLIVGQCSTLHFGQFRPPKSRLAA
ncbi:hypothetical protein [Alteromonas gracilis]|uniref:hypothetical protein n=1 Tax=Alteromonas gracilis TaxID=1479524 RepID=UPI0037353697